jgi:hypothetical protein
MNKATEFRELVEHYMDLFPTKFETVFGEINEKGIDIESKYQDNKAVFNINVNELKEDIKWYSKMAVLLFLDEYFLGSSDEPISKGMNMLYQSITLLIP